MNIIYPYYHLFKAEVSNLIGLVGSQVIIQKKYDDFSTIAITSEKREIYSGSKVSIDNNSIFRIKNYDKNYFHERDNLLFYGTILKKSFVLWDVWDKYNMKFLNTDLYITKYKAHENYRGKFDISLLKKYNNHVYRFINPMLTYYVCT